MQSAAAIYQRNLDAVSDALWRNDVQTMLEHIALPNSMVTEDASLIISSVDEMAIVATEFREHMATLGADGYERVCLAARTLSARQDLIVGLHETRITRNKAVIGSPYLSRMTLICRQGRWQGVLIESDAKNSNLTILSPDLVESQMQALAKLGVSSHRG